MSIHASFFGSCQSASGNDYNWSFAPWNEVEQTCDECDGEGIWYQVYDNDKGGYVKVSQEEYDLLPEEEQEWCEMVRCRKCDGEGYVITH